MSRHPRLEIALVFLAACGREAAPGPAADPYVLASFQPLTYFAQRIAGGKVDVSCPLPAGADPASWQPGRHDIAALQGATLILVNGASFEAWVDKVSLPLSRVVDTSRAFADRFLKFATTTHSHGGGGAHTHAGTNGHTWLDPLLAKLQSQAIHDAFAKAFPRHAALFAQGLAALHQDLDGLHARLGTVSSLLGDTRLLAAHPAYDYLAARYGWKVVNLDLDPAAEPSEEAHKSVAGASAGATRAVLLWEDAPKPAMAKELADLGVRSVVFSPAESVPDAQAPPDDYLAIMRANIDRLEQALR